MNGPQGDKMASCLAEAHFIFCSVTMGRKQSQVTDLMLITCELPPFRKTKVHGKPLYQPYPILLQQHVRGFHLENSVGNVLLVCEAAWLDKLLHHFKRPVIDDFYWPNILPLMTRSRTLLITWIPGHCGNNWADLCQLQSSGPDSLKRTLFQLFKPFLVRAQMS